jgi:hypothetical protein
MTIKKKSLSGVTPAKQKPTAAKQAKPKPPVAQFEETPRLVAAKKLAMAKLATAKLSTARMTFNK